MKEFLSQKGVSYRDFDVSRDRAAAEDMMRKTGQSGVPVIIIDGQTIIGFDRVRLEQALGQRQQTPSFGASIADSSRIAARQGVSMTSGAYVGKVRPGSPAERAGLKAGDIVTELNTQRITNANDFQFALSRLPRGSQMKLVVERGRQSVVLNATA